MRTVVVAAALAWLINSPADDMSARSRLLCHDAILNPCPVDDPGGGIQQILEWHENHAVLLGTVTQQPVCRPDDRRGPIDIWWCEFSLRLDKQVYARWPGPHSPVVGTTALIHFNSVAHDSPIAIGAELLVLAVIGSDDNSYFAGVILRATPETVEEVRDVLKEQGWLSN